MDKKLFEFILKTDCEKQIVYTKNGKDLVFSYLLTYVELIKNPTLQNIATEILKEKKEAFCNKPATDTHHYYSGGLLWHTFCVVRNSIVSLSLYPEVNADLDLVLFGALLHDVGKTFEIEDFSENDDYIMLRSNRSEMLTHAYSGCSLVEKYLDKSDLDIEFKNQVLHSLGAHMNGYGDWGDVHATRMIEPRIINFADNMDSKIEPADIINATKKGDWYKLPWDPNLFQKSKNEYYD